MPDTTSPLTAASPVGLFVLVIILCSVMGCAVDLINAAVYSEQEGAYPEAAQYYRHLGDSGHPVGNYNDARLLEQGLGGARKIPAEAQRRYDAAAGASVRGWDTVDRARSS